MNARTHSVPQSRLFASVPPPSIVEDDEPPLFPSLNSIQRAKPTITVPTFNFSMDSPPPSPSTQPSSPQITIGPNSLITPTTTTKLAKRVKVNIGAGYSQLDWARLKTSGVDLRGGVQQLRRITPSELALHKTREDCWQSYNGKVYNITPFLKYHPGGPGELMRAAGRDGELFCLTRGSDIDTELLRY